MSRKVCTSVSATPPVVNNQYKIECCLFSVICHQNLFITVRHSGERKTPLPFLGSNVGMTTVVAFWHVAVAKVWNVALLATTWCWLKGPGNPAGITDASFPSLVHLSAWHSSERNGLDNKSTLCSEQRTKASSILNLACKIRPLLLCILFRGVWFSWRCCSY